MSVLAHLHTLQDRHHLLETSIASEVARPLPDFVAITALKKQKLHLKEEIEQIYRDHPEIQRIAS